MATYRVLSVRKPFGGLAPGTLVELADAEAQGFLDKLEPVVEPTENTLTESATTKIQRGRKRKV